MQILCRYIKKESLYYSLFLISNWRLYGVEENILITLTDL